MEIAENITWTEELERLDVLLSQGQFELLLPGERYGGGEKEIWLVYLMNDAAESFLVFHDAELTGTYQKEYEGEIDAALEKDGEQYVLIVRQGETVCTLFFSRLSLEVHHGLADDHRLHRGSRTLPFPPSRPHRRLLERSRQGTAGLSRAEGMAAEKWGRIGCLR